MVGFIKSFYQYQLLFQLSSQTVKGFEFEIRWKFNQDFSNCGCLHCAIRKALYTFKVTRAHSQKLFQNIQNEILENFKMFKNMKFTRVACWINSKIKKHYTQNIFMLSLFLVITML